MKKSWASATALTAIAIAIATSVMPTAASASPESSPAVRNTGDYAIGAIDNWRGGGPLYRNGYYDDLIPAHQSSGYPSTGGFYVGPNFCVRGRTWLNSTGSQLAAVHIFHGSVQVELEGFTYGVDLRAYPTSNALCWNP
jgi:hypothetical protein